MSSNLVNLDILNENQIPKNIEAEQTILGSILTNNEIFDEITDQLDENYFFDPIHQKIYKIISNLISKGLLANPVTIKNFFNSKEELVEIGGVDYLIKLKFDNSITLACPHSTTIDSLYFIHSCSVFCKCLRPR